MNRLSALLVVSLVLLQHPATAAAAVAASGSSDDQHECCLCNDCDMMMNAEASVYDLDEGRLMACSDFAELVFYHVPATSETCHTIQGFYQSSCCMNANLQQEQEERVDPATAVVAAADEETTVDRRRTLQHQPAAEPLSIPFSRRELQFNSAWSATSARAAWPAPQPTYAYKPFTPPTPGAFSYAPANTNGNALGCTVPSYNNAKTVQVFRSTGTGFSAPTGINCSTASRSGIGMSTSDSMYQVSLKCVICNCCGVCTGLDANVCVGNNQPRPNSGNGLGLWTSRIGGRRRFLEFLNM